MSETDMETIVTHYLPNEERVVAAIESLKMSIRPGAVLAVYRALMRYTRGAKQRWRVAQSSPSLVEHEVYPSQETIRKMTMFSVRSIQRSIKVLVTLEALRVEVHRVGHAGNLDKRGGFCKTRNRYWMFAPCEPIMEARAKWQKAKQPEKPTDPMRIPKSRSAFNASKHTSDRLHHVATGSRTDEVSKERARDELLKIGTPYKSKGIFLKAFDMAKTMGVDAGVAYSYSLAIAPEMIEIMKYANQFILRSETRAGWTIKQAKRALVGLPYGKHCPRKPMDARSRKVEE